MKSKILIVFILLIATTQTAASQTGGAFDLSHAVTTASGGSSSTGAAFRVDGTIGQNLAGTISMGGAFSVRGGFWAFESLAPTAATVTISGRVTNGKRGAIIQRARISLLDTLTGIERTAQTSINGSFRFEEVETGRFYIIRAVSKNIQFMPQFYAFQLTEERSDLDFVGSIQQP